MALFTRKSDESAPIAGGVRWTRQSGEFARRIEAKDLRGILSRNLDVDEGTRGLLFQYGAYHGDLSPGRHTIESVTQRIKSLIFTSPISALIVDDGQNRLRLEANRLLTSDDQEVSAAAIVVVELADPLKLFVNMVRGEQVLTIDKVCGFFQPGIGQALSHLVRSATIRDLAHPYELGERLEDDIRTRMADSFSSAGLRFVRLDFVKFGAAGHDELSRSRGRLSLREAQAELEARQRELERRIEAEATLDRMAKIESEAELREFISRGEFEAKTSDLARELQWQKIFDDFIRVKEDLEAQRELVRRTRRQQNELELAALKYEFDLKILRNQQSLERTTEEFEREKALRRFDDELKHRGILFRATLDERVATAHTESELADIERERNRRDSEARLARQKARAEFALELTRRSQQMDQESRQFDLQLRQSEQQAGFARAEAEKDGAHRRKLDELVAMDRVRVETLVAVSDGPQSAHLSELLKLEAYKGLTPEQILMVKAAESPAVAAALAEKFRSEASGNTASQATERALYERLLQEARDSRSEIKEFATGTIGEIRQATGSALQSQRDVAVAAVSNSEVGPRAQPPQMGATSCRGGGEQMAAADKFCGKCGKSRLGF